jgi:hypothetical protein
MGLLSSTIIRVIVVKKTRAERRSTINSPCDIISVASDGAKAFFGGNYSGRELP